MHSQQIAGGCAPGHEAGSSSISNFRGNGPEKDRDFWAAPRERHLWCKAPSGWLPTRHRALCGCGQSRRARVRARGPVTTSPRGASLLRPETVRVLVAMVGGVRRVGACDVEWRGAMRQGCAATRVRVTPHPDKGCPSTEGPVPLRWQRHGYDYDWRHCHRWVPSPGRRLVLPLVRLGLAYVGPARLGMGVVLRRGCRGKCR